MAWPDFALTDLYTAIITKLNTGFTNVGKLFLDQTTGDYTNQIRYSTANKRLEYWTGSAWAALDVSSSTIANATASTNATNHIAAATGAEHGATNASTANMIVRRDGSGNFSAGAITANLTGNVAGNVTGNLTGNVTGNVTGDVTGTASNATKLNNQLASYYQPAASAITTSNISAQSVNYATSAGNGLKAWTYFNGVLGASVFSSYGVTVSRIAFGTYRFTFTTAMIDTNYLILAPFQLAEVYYQETNKTTTSVDAAIYATDSYSYQREIGGIWFQFFR